MKTFMKTILDVDNSGILYFSFLIRNYHTVLKRFSGTFIYLLDSISESSLTYSAFGKYSHPFPFSTFCVEAQIWGRVPKNVCSIEGPQKHSGLHHS